MIVIVGPMGSGKSTLLNQLVKTGMKRVITFTTRPPREGEVNGVDYYFVSDTKFKDMLANGEFMETTSYDTVHGTWLYGSTKSAYEDENGVIILNPDGLKKLTVPAFIVYLRPPNEVMLQRVLKRGDCLEEITRRVATDRRDFEELDTVLGLYDIKISYELNIDKITHAVIRRYKGGLI